MDITYHNLIRNFLLIFSLNLFTAGCVSTVGIATTGVQAVYNHNHLRQQLADQYITMQAYRKLFTDTDRFKNSSISVATLNNEVLLVGQTPDPSQPQEAEQIIKTIQGVDKVYNHLTISAPSSALTQLSDSWMTTKVKSKLIAMNDVNPDHIKVVTENGTVYLMGIVLPEEGNIAVQVASETQGVQEVVKLFYYMNISRTTNSV